MNDPEDESEKRPTEREEWAPAPDLDISPEDVDAADVGDLSTEELVALSEGGVVDEQGNATAFGEAAPEDVDPEETAAELVDHLEEMSQEDNSTQQELFSDEWIAAHTDFETVEAFLAAGPWDEGTEIIDVPTADLDAHAAAHTEFDTWAELSQSAGDQWLESKLDLSDL